MINWKIEKRNIEQLKGYDKNPRKFTKKGLEDLRKSLENCGDANIITINADNTVLGGHARLQVMKELGYKEVDVKVPDRLLTEKECEEIIIRLNANTAGEWDFEKLELDFDIEELNKWGLDIDINIDIDNSTKEAIEEEKPEIKFTEELLEEHNYIVLYFDNSVDWLQAETLFDLKQVQALKSKENFKKVGVGRVLKGSIALEKIRNKIKEMKYEN